MTDIDTLYQAQEDMNDRVEQAVEDCKSHIRGGGNLDDVVVCMAQFHKLDPAGLRAIIEEWAGDSVTW